jgi:hypothetical protein
MLNVVQVRHNFNLYLTFALSPLTSRFSVLLTKYPIPYLVQYLTKNRKKVPNFHRNEHRQYPRVDAVFEPRVF